MRNDMTDRGMAPGASEVFSDQILQGCIVQHLLRQQLLQTPVLVLQRPQTLRIRGFQTAKLGLPFEERRSADPVPPAQVLRLRSRLLFLQEANDLLFREPALPHRRSPLDRLNYQMEGIPGSRSDPIHLLTQLGITACPLFGCLWQTADIR